MTFAYVLIIVNLYSIQVRKSHLFLTLAQQQYQMEIVHHPPRALIYDRSDIAIALNKQGIAAILLPKEITDKQAVYSFLKTHFPSAVTRYQSGNYPHFMYIKRRLNEEQIRLIEQQPVDGIILLHEPSRYYPFPVLVSVLGMTDVDNQGLFGIEQRYNEQLTGKAGTVRLLKDARSGHYYFEKTIVSPETMGIPVTLSIDSTLSFLAAQELEKTMLQFKATEGSVIILNPITGEILTMITLPYSDPNNPAALTIEHTKNSIMSNAYESGSVFKVFCALAALEAGVVTEEELIDCKGAKTAYVDGMAINTWKANDIIPFKDVIAYSNNIGIATVAKRLGQSLYDHYKKLGFGIKTNIELSGEARGFLNHPRNWSKRSIISLSFGYEVSATSLQIACAFGILANEGKPVTPTIIKVNNNSSNQSPPLYSANTIATMRSILLYSTMQKNADLVGLAGCTIMGKTGTANLIENGQYNKNKNIFTYAGLVEKDNYKRVIVAFIKESNQHNIYASSVVAPLFKRIAQKMIIHENML